MKKHPWPILILSWKTILKNFFINIGNGSRENCSTKQYGQLAVTMCQYNEFLQKLGEFNLLNDFMECRFFSCQKCKTFSVKIQSFYALLKKIAEHNEIAEALVYDLKESVDIEPWQLELSDQPNEIKEKFLDDYIDYPEMFNAANIKDLVVEDEMVFRFPYEDCSFVFDTTCDCNRILRA